MSLFSSEMIDKCWKNSWACGSNSVDKTRKLCDFFFKDDLCQILQIRNSDKYSRKSAHNLEERTKIVYLSRSLRSTLSFWQENHQINMMECTGKKACEIISQKT